jgi:SAM-dependent methyltransferase
VDIVPHPDQPHITQADLATEPIPFPDDTFDLVSAYDFLEHLPMTMYVYNPKTHRMEQRSCMIALFNEIYRVLKDGGEFYSQTPVYPSNAVFQDPTHQSVWTTETFYYFSGDYFGFREHYLHTSRFELIKKEVVNDHLYVTLRTIKNLPPDSPYLLHYESL